MGRGSAFLSCLNSKLFLSRLCTPSPQLTSPNPHTSAPHTPAGNLPLPRQCGSKGSVGSSLLFPPLSLFFKSKGPEYLSFASCIPDTGSLRAPHPLEERCEQGATQAIPCTPHSLLIKVWTTAKQPKSFQTQTSRMSSLVMNLNTSKSKTKLVISRHFLHTHGDNEAQIKKKKKKKAG